ncbi:TetR/AcrR family transcriptional regulator [Candidatus Sulfidibacterium hydrothermale]|uniref:TetR/AcrR family transcriptional regulator n=1 Tax=Candidatus Sulfidibacterium hydrothermale TaxID=2875962 RepID=UPI001F0B7044|nr:TetR/AcrR family transcriptional regulator [Candidatus Sulfidibacterium hydrothermale]UBM61232.1 TetR/AcrR family transcriptional regulator [Candidatus Sulfidibacterium hydrothermale]
MLTNRQFEIIDTAVDIIARNGIQGLTIKNLAKEIGISEPGIYRHFESKTDILLALLANFEEMLSIMDKGIQSKEENTLDKIKFLFSRIVEIFSNEPSRISVVFSEEIFKNDPKLKEKIVNILNDKIASIGEIIHDGQRKGEIRKDIDHYTLAMIIIGSLRLMVKKWDLTSQTVNLHEEGVKLVDGLTLILKG